MYNNDLNVAKFDENGLSTQSGWAKVYRADHLTREYIGYADMDNVPYRASVAADAYLDAPVIPTEKNVAIVRSDDGKSWINKPDYRGQDAFNTKTGEKVTISNIGEIPEGLTFKKPATEFDQWNGSKWVTNKDLLHKHEVKLCEDKKLYLLSLSESQISMLERKVKLGMATNEETEKLKEWEVYSVNLSNVDTSKAPDVEFPVEPE